MTDSKLPTPEEQQGESERRWAEYSPVLEVIFRRNDDDAGTDTPEETDLSAVREILDLRAEIAALTERLREAEQDTKRMDWMEACTPLVALQVLGGYDRALATRRAVDAAMNPSSPEGK